MLISVIVPNYNHAKFLSKRIDSILQQAYQNFELIIMDDCSQDNSLEIINQYNKHPKVSQVIINEQNSGSTFKQWKRGIELAKGDWIWIAESDDYCDREFLYKLVEKISLDNKLVVIYSQSYVVDESGLVVGDMNFFTDTLDSHHWKTDYVNNGFDEINNYLLFRNTIPNASAVLFKKEAYLEVEKDYESMKLCGDWMLWIQLLKYGNIAFCAQPLNYFRTHNTTTRVLNNVQKLRMRLEEEFDIALNIENYLGKKEKVVTSRLDEISNQYGLSFTKSELLNLAANSFPFYKNTIINHLFKLKMERLFLKYFS